MQPCSIPSLFRLLPVALVVAILAATSAGAGRHSVAGDYSVAGEYSGAANGAVATQSRMEPGDVLTRLGGWTEAPAHVELFAPRTQRTRYRAYVSARPLTAALESLAQEPSLLRTPGAWAPRSLGVRDAFGDSGRYNRWDLARLYVSTAVSVARGPREEQGRVVESWMLFSPYPDSTMSALQQGTLLLVVPVAPL